MKTITRRVSLLLIITTLIFVSQVSALSPLTISSSDVGSTAIISGLPEGTDVQFVLNNGVPVPMKIGSDGIAKYLLLLEGTLETHASFQGNTIDNFSITLQSPNTPPPTSSESSGSGSSGGGTYPTITTTGTPTATLTVTPIETTVEPTITTPQQTENVEVTETATPIPTQKSPGFGTFATIVAIGLIGAIYILRRK